MSGSGYDYSCGTFSPDGRIFQIEYANKAVENSGTAIGIKCIDGVVIAIGKPQGSKMLVPSSNRRVFSIDKHAGIVATGYQSDGRQIVNRAREEASSYRDTYGAHIIPSVLANRLSLYVHYFTSYGSLRPFGVTSVLAAFDEDTKTPELYMLEPSGLALRYFGCAAGKGANAAKTELEKLLNNKAEAGITCRDAVTQLTRILNTIRDPTKDKSIEIEMGWLCDESNMRFTHVPEEFLSAAQKCAEQHAEQSAEQTNVEEMQLEETKS